MTPPLPDRTSRPSLQLAIELPPEPFARVALRARAGREAIGVVDTDPLSPRYGRVVERIALAPGEAGLHRCDVARHPGLDAMVTGEAGSGGHVLRGLDPERLRAGGYGHVLHVWELGSRRHRQAIDLGAEHQLVLRLCAAHNPTRAWGLAGVALSLADLSSSVFLWYLDRGGQGGRVEWRARKVITIPAEAADAGRLPPLLRGFAAVPPLVTDINLSADDRFLYVSCWGTGELRQYDVSDPFNPVLTGSVRLGGIAGRTPHPRDRRRPLDGGPQRVEVSRDGRRIYATNSLSAPWDAQFYPDGVRGWMAKCETGRHGGLALDPGFLCEFDDGEWPRQLRLDGGDASCDCAAAEP